MIQAPMLQAPRAKCSRCKGEYSVNEFLADLRLCNDCRRGFLTVEEIGKCSDGIRRTDFFERAGQRTS